MSTTRLETGQLSAYEDLKHAKTGRAHLYVGVCVQYHKEARDTQDLLKRLDKELDQKYNPEFKDVYQMEGMIGEIDVSISVLIHVKLLIPLTPSTALKWCFLCVHVFVQDQAKAMEHFDDRIKALQKRSLQVLPLSYRRETPQKLLPIEALCEFDTEEVLTWGLGLTWKEIIIIIVFRSSLLRGQKIDTS